METDRLIIRQTIFDAAFLVFGFAFMGFLIGVNI